MKLVTITYPIPKKVFLNLRTLALLAFQENVLPILFPEGNVLVHKKSFESHQEIKTLPFGIKGYIPFLKKMPKSRNETFPKIN